MPILEFHLDDRSPFDRVFTIAKDARLPKLEVQLLDGASSVDLSTGTVKFAMVSAEDVIDVTLANASWTAATNLLTETGAFVNYTFKDGDQIFLSKSGVADGVFRIASKTDANSIVLEDAFDAADKTGVKTAKVDDAAGTLEDGLTGLVSYSWAAVDTDAPGRYAAQFLVTVSSKDYRIPAGDQRLFVIVGERVN